MTKEDLEKENEELKKEVERLKEENKNWELRYNLIKIELELRPRDLSQISEQCSDLLQISKQG